ncbi:hypothetical protein BCR35DRAFT_310021 [Leucosporidium creatinivorum]|uniref:RING-type domain-containing protein n=1 Tax=Leucosporidium creatinivorum TaxID=106004 RepID=A0A1Y2D8S2_9BASI|nr:hypothetical protein BCR35DRAFT_310021 [Leucosporidium creatinivorum]
MPGISTELFPQGVSEHLTCSICHDVLNAGAFSCDQQHVACSECLKEWIAKEPSCPTCRVEVKEVVESPILSRMVKSLKCKCSQEGCDWTGEYSELAPHLDSVCSYYPRACSKAALGCDSLVSNAELPAHLDDDCLFNEKECPRGGRDCGGPGLGLYLSKDWSDHYHACQQHSCRIQGCTTIGSADVIALHKPGCREMDRALKEAEKGRAEAEQGRAEGQAEVEALRARVKELEGKPSSSQGQPFLPARSSSSSRESRQSRVFNVAAASQSKRGRIIPSTSPRRSRSPSGSELGSPVKKARS